ncbi:SRPBCC family protein [Archangium sp.]|uniref:SRPBCC family protein n=1 Tax=Archangium sp. TaxID=1872627 RepID=UPI00389AE227
MAIIRLNTLISAPLQRCFDLSRSIDMHLASAASSDEQAIAGVTTGLIGAGQEVTWRARHFGIWLTLTSRITAFNPSRHFRDSMVRGPFRRFDHDHFFAHQGDATLMTDVFDFESPLGVAGRFVDWLILRRHMQAFLMARNETLRNVAQSDDWRRFLTPETGGIPSTPRAANVSGV